MLTLLIEVKVGVKLIAIRLTIRLAIGLAAIGLATIRFLVPTVEAATALSPSVFIGVYQALL